MQRRLKIYMEDETDFKNTAYKAIIGELELLEANGMYKGNGHHLAQRLVEMLITEFKIKEMKS